MRYTSFANILVEHEYYRGTCSSFFFVPSKSAKEEIARQNLILRDTNGCLKLFGPEDLVDSVGALCFGVCAKDPDLWNVTFFDSSDSGMVPVYVVEGNSYTIKKESLEELKKDLDVPGLMFVVKVLSRSLQKEFKPLKIQLETRKCRWRYNIKGDYSQYDIKIHSLNDGNDTFFDAEKRTDDLFVFTSKEKIPVVYGDVPKFQLRTKDTSRILMKALPNMDSRSLSRIESKGGGYEIVAESFINL